MQEGRQGGGHVEEAIMSLAVRTSHAFYMLQYPHRGLRDALAQVILSSLNRSDA